MAQPSESPFLAWWKTKENDEKCSSKQGITAYQIIEILWVTINQIFGKFIGNKFCRYFIPIRSSKFGKQIFATICWCWWLPTVIFKCLLFRFFFSLSSSLFSSRSLSLSLSQIVTGQTPNGANQTKTTHKCVIYDPNFRLPWILNVLHSAQTLFGSFFFSCLIFYLRHGFRSFVIMILCEWVYVCLAHILTFSFASRFFFA